jgi:hypothetical protein
MRIAVTATGCEFDTQTRAYAEYRVFSSVARFSDRVSRAAVLLKTATGRQPDVLCSIVLTMHPARHTRVHARGRHACDAIDRAAARAGDVLARHASGASEGPRPRRPAAAF